MSVNPVSAPLEADSPVSPDGGNGRDSRGRFAKGNAGGPGNPFARRSAALRKAAAQAISEEDLVALMRKLLQQALGGDVAAARLVLLYAVGRPAEAVDPDMLDQQEYAQYEQQLGAVQTGARVVSSPEVGMLCELARATRPHIKVDFLRQFQQGLEEMAAADSEEPEEPMTNGDDGASQPGEEAPEATREDTAPIGNGENRGDSHSHGDWVVDGEPMVNGDDGGPGTEEKAASRPKRPSRWVPPWEEAGPALEPG
jgi:hypothetical protein